MVDQLDDLSHALDRMLDQHADAVGYLEVEMLLQDRAQDMRECAYAEGRADIIHADDLDGWTE